MFDSDKEYWLYIASYVYCCIKEGRALLYNTQTGDHMETAVPEVIALLESLYEKKNLGCIRCAGKQLEELSYRDFIAGFCKKNMGGVAAISQVPKKPVQLMPVLNLQHEPDKLKVEDGRCPGEDILRYLLELNIYVCTDCGQHCPYCEQYSRQNLCCSAFSGKFRNQLELSILEKLLAQIQYSTVGQLNLLGGNLFEYHYYKDLPQLLAPFADRTHFWNHYTAFAKYKEFVSDFAQDIVVTFPIQQDLWEHCVFLLKNQVTHFHFYITGAEEYQNAGILAARYKINKYNLHPIYTGKNYDFFKEYIFLDHEDILQQKLSFRQIFAHQKLNTHFFGTLTVLADGEVYSNVNSVSLGNIANVTLLDIISQEMVTNSSWRRIRDAAPCSGCLYQYLCPSPSNYETVINKMNLCHIKP